MSSRFSPIVAVAVAAAWTACGCGRVGIELLGFDGSVPGPPPDGGPGDASDIDADLMDASEPDANDEFDGAQEAAVPVEAGEPDAAGAPDATLSDASLADASLPDASDTGTPDAYVDAGPQPCDFSGTWVTKVEFPVSWSGNLGVNAGSGTATVWVKHQSQANANVVPGTMVSCGVTLPGFGLTVFAGGGTGRVSFAVPLFDNNPPAVSTQPVLQIQGAGFPGDPMTMSPTALVLGATLADPLNGTWPSAAQLTSDDFDGDGRPGVTLPHLNGGGYVYLPIEAFAASRSEAGYYASRVTVSVTGSVVSCAETTGQAQIPRFDSRILGCRRVGGAECSTTQSNLLESFRPDHVPGTGTYRALKIADNATCAMARSALP